MTQLIHSKRIWYGGAASVALALLLAIGLRAQGPGVILGCVSPNGGVRVLIGNDTCRTSETAISWNAVGQQGPQGLPGPAGAAGTDGQPGVAGRDGRDGRDCQAATPAAPTVIGQIQADGLTGVPAGTTTPIVSFNVGASNPGAIVGGGGGGAGKVSFTDFTVGKMVDGFSTALLNTAETGRHLKLVQIDIYEPGTTNIYATYQLADVVVTSDVFGALTGALNESVGFAYDRLTTDITINGQHFHSCFDRSSNLAC